MRLAPLLACLLVAGCTPSAKHVGGAAAPVTAAPISAPVPPSISAPASSPPPSPARSSPAATTPAKSSGGGARSLVLGPKGLGALKLRMTMKQATATGLIGTWRGDGVKSCAATELKAATGNGGTVQSGAGGRGVVSIDAYGTVATPEGIRLGSSLAAVLKAYPGLQVAQGGTVRDANGIGFIDVPGNSNASYRIQWESRKVADLTLQDDGENCYE